MNKAHTLINWENYPSVNTPLNEANLNKLDSSVDVIDNRVVEMDANKASKVEVNSLVADVTFDESTGIFTVTKKNGSAITIDTKMEKIAVNFTYDSTTQQIILTLIDGTKQYINLSALITQYEFINSDTITFVVQTDGSIKAEVLDGSITENKLQPNYLAQIRVETAKSETYMNNAGAYSVQSQSYAVGGTGTRDNEDIDNAKHYYEQAKMISESLSGALKPMGTVTFADLPTLSSASEGDMYNISNEFTTTSDFKEGSGFIIPAGSNVYKTSDGYWDVLAGSPVTGIKGNKEVNYRKGNVNITPDNIGAVATDGDTSNTTVAFSSADVEDGSATAWTSVSPLTSGEKHSSLFGKISTMFKNIRYLYKMLGSTDISAIGDGTATGAINELNNNLKRKYLGVAKYNNPLAFPSEWDEMVVYATNGYYCAETTIVKGAPTLHYLAGIQDNYVRFIIANNQFVIQYSMLDGNDNTSAETGFAPRLAVYYR